MGFIHTIVPATNPQRANLSDWSETDLRKSRELGENEPLEAEWNPINELSHAERAGSLLAGDHNQVEPSADGSI